MFVTRIQGRRFDDETDALQSYIWDAQMDPSAFKSYPKPTRLSVDSISIIPCVSRKYLPKTMEQAGPFFGDSD
jgi:hypothetical protein